MGDFVCRLPLKLSLERVAIDVGHPGFPTSFLLPPLSLPFRFASLCFAMWTRHFYDRDAVGETFVWLYSQHKDPLRKVKMTFWAHELWISEEVPFLLETLRRTWDVHGHPLYPLPVSSDPLVLLGALLVQPVLPTSFPPPFSAPMQAPAISDKPPIVPPTLPSKWSAEQRVRLWRAVRDAVVKRQTERLYRLLAGVPRSAAILTDYLGIRVGKDVKSAYVGGTLGLQHILCREGGLVWKTWPPQAPYEPAVVKWPTGLPVGFLAARRFAIPKHLLPKVPMEPSGFGTLSGCQVWQRLLTEAGVDRAASEAVGYLVFRDGDEAFEAFYDAVFGTTDIPDEWSKAEKAKSHLHDVTISA